MPLGQIVFFAEFPATAAITLRLTPMHAEAGMIKSTIATVHAAIQHVKAAAEQLPTLNRSRVLPHYIFQRIVGQIGLPTSPSTLSALG